ncbi:MAG TPA: AbrB/MazE/SpoVT family DNA-binding domain-containing protein [Terracidiphilus sp.]|nr:AbrB/MazE/SpoVT family DNA-binding domain-containing protein [Terracidiphilus sp.]
MKVAKWGNSLAIRIPAGIAEKAGLKEGDEASIALTAGNVIEIRRDQQRRVEAIEALKKLRVPLPEGYVFRRSDIYDE